MYINYMYIKLNKINNCMYVKENKNYIKIKCYVSMEYMALAYEKFSI